MALFCKSVLSLLLAQNVDAKQVFNVKDPEFGAVDDGKTDSAKAIQKAFDATKEYIQQGGTDASVLFPTTQNGFYFGPVQFEGLHNAVIEFEEGAQMLLLKSNKTWPLGGEHHIPWIHGSNSVNLTIQGGIFEGNGDWWGNLVKKTAHMMKRPRMMDFSGMKHFTVRDMTLRNAPTGHFSVSGSDWVEISNLRLDTPIPTMNTDGLGFNDCHHVWAHDLFVQNGDDSIQAGGGSSDILIERGTIIGGHGLNFGGATSRLEVQDVIWRDLNLSDMHRGTRIKITPKTTGFIKNITYENLNMTRVEYPMGIQTNYGPDSTAEPLHSSSSKYTFGDIKWINIHAVDGSHDGLGMGTGGGGSIQNPGQFNCTKDAPCKDLHFSNVTIITDTPWVCKECDCSASKTVPHASICHLSPGLSTSNGASFIV